MNKKEEHLEETSMHYLPKIGWMHTLTKILRYKAKKGDTIVVADSTQLEHVTSAVINKAADLELTVILHELPPEEDKLILL